MRRRRRRRRMRRSRRDKGEETPQWQSEATDIDVAMVAVEERAARSGSQEHW